MSAIVVCPHCGSRLKSVSAPVAGKAIKCPKCAKPFRYDLGTTAPTAPRVDAPPPRRGSGGKVAALLGLLLLLGGAGTGAWWSGLLPKVLPGLSDDARANDGIGEGAAADGDAAKTPAAASNSRQDLVNALPAETRPTFVAGGPAKLEGNAAPILDLVYDPAGGRLASSDVTGAVRIWNLATGVPTVLAEGVTERYAPLPHPVALAFSRDGATLFAGGAVVTAYDAASGKPRRTFGTALDPAAPSSGPQIPLTISSDGSKVVTADYPGDGTTRFRVWDTATGKERLAFDPGKLAGGNDLRFDADGKTLAVVESPLVGGTQVRLFDVAQGKERPPIRQGYEGLFFLPGGRLLGWRIARFDRFCDDWELGDGSRPAKLLAETPVPLDKYPRLAGTRTVLSSDGRTLAYGADGVVLWDVVDRKVRATIPGGGEDVRLTRDGGTSLSLGKGSRQQRSDGTDASAVEVVEGDAAAGSVRRLHELGVAAPLPLGTSYASKFDAVLAVAPDGRGFAVGMTDGSILLRPLGGASQTPSSTPRLVVSWPLRGVPSQSAIRFSADGRHLVTSGSHTLGPVVIYNALTGDVRLAFDLEAERAPGGAPPAEWNGDYSGGPMNSFAPVWQKTVALPASLTLPPNRDVVLFTNKIGHRFSIDLKTGTWRVFPMAFLKVPPDNQYPDGLHRSYFTKYEHLVAAPGGDAAVALVEEPLDFSRRKQRLSLLDAETLAERKVLTEAVDLGNAIFSPDGRTLLYAARRFNAELKLLDLATGRDRPTTVEGGRIGGLSSADTVWFTRGGNALVTYDRFAARYYDLETGQLTHTLDLRRGHPNNVTVAAIPAGDGLFASGGVDGEVLLRDPATGDVRSRLTAHEGHVRSMAFAPDGRTLATAGEDGMLKVWNVSGK